MRTRVRFATVACAYTVVVVVLAFVEGLGSPSLPRSNIRYRDGSVEVNAIARGDLLDRAGVMAGDRIRTLDGREFFSLFDLNAGLRARGPGATVELGVEREGAELCLTVDTTRNLSLGDAVRVMIPVLVLLGIGIAVFAVRPGMNAALLLLIYCLMCVINDVAQITFLVGPAWPQRVLTFAYTMTSLASAAVLLHLLLVFPVQGRVQSFLRPILPAMYAVQVGLGLNYYLPTVIPAASRWLSRPEIAGPMVRIFTSSVALCYLLGFVSLVSALRSSTHPRVRAQALVLAVGLAALVVLQLVFVEIPLRTDGRVLVSAPAQSLFDLIVPLCVAAAIIGYRLFDINVLIRHGMVYGGASALVAMAFVAFMAVFGWISERVWHGTSGVTLAVAAALAAILFHPARVWAQELVDRVLYRRRYDYRTTLTEAGSRLASIVETSAALEYLQSRISAALEPVWMEIVIDREREENAMVAFDALGRPTRRLPEAIAGTLRAELDGQVQPYVPTDDFRLPWWSGEPALVVPVIRGDSCLGVLVLGPRADEIPYLPEDRDFVGVLAQMTGAVLESARLLEERSVRERLALLGTAASSMIHELKNPLGAMRSTLAVLRRRLRDDPRGTELTHIVDEEVERLKERVMNVLTYVRPQSLPSRVVSVTEIVQQLIPVVENEFTNVGVSIEFAGDSESGLVEGDGERLRQAFLNLLLNAREAMTTGGAIRVAVFERSEGSQNSVEVVVQDTGPGFAEESLRSAFEPFFTTKSLGTGLGLANVERIVAEHGGTVEIGNTAEGGASVRVKIPAYAFTSV